jgi:hypothetical protein
LKQFVSFTAVAGAIFGLWLAGFLGIVEATEGLGLSNWCRVFAMSPAVAVLTLFVVTFFDRIVAQLDKAIG